MRDMEKDLLSEIEEFLRETGMPKSTFERAVGNQRLLERLRTIGKRGRPGRVWPETEQAIRDFMAEERAKRAEVSKPDEAA